MREQAINYTPFCSLLPLVNERCMTGENPFWNPRDDSVWWTDIPTGRLFRYDRSARSPVCVYRGEQVGGFTLQANGDWLLFRVKDIARMTLDHRMVSLLPFSDAGAKRFNDVIAAPEGHIFAGTIGTDRESGGLYRIDRDGSITRLFTGTGIANGMGFSPDRQTFYWTDSTARCLHRFRYDPASGALSDRSLLYQALPDEGIPDGLAVDAEGFLWSARYNGSRIMRHDPSDGRVVGFIDFPVRAVTSLCFGGPERDRLFVTTAGGDGGESVDSDANTPADGTLYEVYGGLPSKGLPEFVSRILL